MISNGILVVFLKTIKNGKEYNQVATEIKNLDRFKGNLAKSGQDLYEGITEILSVNRRLEKVYVYATMSSDVDTSNTHYLGLVAKAQSLANQMSAAISFVDPEILSIPEKTLAKFMQDEPRLKSINIDLNKLLRNVLILYQQVKKNYCRCWRCNGNFS